MNGVPEQVTTYWSLAKQAEKQLESRNREVRIVPCVEVPESYADPFFECSAGKPLNADGFCECTDFIAEEPTEPDIKLGPHV